MKTRILNLLSYFIVSSVTAQVSFTGSPYVQNFNTLSGTTNNQTAVTWTDNATLVGWYASKSGYHVTDGTMGGTASSFDSTSNTNNIGLISFGAAGSTDRALGSRATGTASLGTSNAPVQYGVRLVNNTSQTITSFSVMFTGEQWFASTQSAAHTLQVDYSVGATSLTTGTYTSNFVTFTAPISTGTTARALDGNASANRVGVARKVTGISWAPGQDLWIRITDTNETGNEQGMAIDDFVFTSEPNSALFFNGASNHVTMGAATSTLGATVFTLEAWIFRTGTGTTASTGTGGVSAYPIVTKGRGESETAGLNCNYFLGINAANQLVADFEAAAATGITTGQNYPVAGSSTIPFHQWVHVAASYDGNATDGEKWKLFVNGVKDTTASTTGVNPPANAHPEAISTQHFAIGTAMNSSGTREGTFLGLIDEVRVWNVARTEAEISANKSNELTSGVGLLARYGLGEGSGTTTASSVTGAPNGTLSGSPVWMHGYSFSNNALPTVTLTSPAEGSSYDAPAAISLGATAADSDGTISKVEFYAGATKLGEDNTAPYEFLWENAITGSYVLTARAIDNLGGQGTSSGVNISVTNVDNVPPSVAISAPANNATILTNSITITASAADSDGLVSKVEFFNGSTKLGEDTTAPYSFTWSNVSPGSYLLTAVATDNDGAATTSSSVSVSVVTPVTNTIIAKGATWKYLDDGSNQGAAWREAAFNDSSWASGPAKLGYEDGAVTVLRQGPDGMTSSTKFITYYFRRSFNVSGASAVQQINLNILRDDGVVVYINGVEVARQNMPSGAIDYLTNSASIVSGADETTYFPSIVSPASMLVEGTNVIAVELHQRDNASSDLGFDMELITVSAPGPAPTVSLTSPVNGAEFSAPASITLSAAASDEDGSVTKVEFFNGATKLGEDAIAPYSFVWNGVAQGDYTLSARATDDQGQSTVSLPVTISVGPPNTTPPTVAITSPSQGAMFVAPASITIQVDAADSDGSVTKVEFYNGAIKLGEDSVPPYSLVWSGVAAGSYTLTARATDDMTATTTSAAITVNVNVNQPPAVSLVSPAHLATGAGVGGTVQLSASVSDPDNQPLNVTFYGRLKSPPPGPDFTLVTIPDTQFYSENSGGNRLQHFTSQTNWIVSSRAALNTVFVAHMGDMVQNGDSVLQEWINADGAMSIIENPLTTLLTHGIPWGGAPGNHDQQPIGSPDGASVYWNTYFGTARWAGRPYWGGNYSTNNDNNYQLFSASGLDFIIVNMEYRPSANQAVLDWADSVLKAFPNRRAIVTSHWLIGTSTPPAQAAWGGHGQAVYDNLKDNPNLFLMLCGHIHGEGRRQDVFEGRVVNTVLQDYQSRTNGGDSWLRYFIFSPANNTITAKTYQTRTGLFETDADSEFTLSYDMSGASASWTELGTVSTSGGTVTLDWTGLAGATEYEWYAAVSDGDAPVGSTVRSFTTASNTPPTVTLTAPVEGSMVEIPSKVSLAATASDPDGSVVKVEFYAGAAKVGEDTTVPFAFEWTAISGSYTLTAVAIDDQGASTVSAPVNITVTNPSNTAPTISITSPGSGFSTESTSLTISANASDTDGVITKVEFYQGSTKLGEDTTEPYSYHWTGVLPGSYTLTTVATDNDGAATTSAAVSVTFTPPGNFLGSMTQTFDSMGTMGTTPPGTWTVWNAVSPTTNSTWSSSVSASDLPGMISVSPLTATTTPSGNNMNGFNAALSAGNTDDRVLVSSPTSTAGMAFQLLLSNGTGAAIDALRISFDTVRYTTASTVNELPGYWVFYSLNGGTTWTNVPQLNGSITTVPNTTGTSVTPSTLVELNSNWNPGSQLLIRWVDDNASQTSPDQIVGLNNVTILKAVADTDGDGIPNAWEIANGSDPNANDTGADHDLDGLTLYEEYILGLNPQLADQYEWSVTPQAGTGHMEITFPTLPGRLYRVRWSPDLVEWFPASEQVSGNGELMTYVDDGTATGSPPGAGQRFYEVEVGLAP